MIGVGKTKLALYLTGIFLAGGISGWVIAARMDKQKTFKPPQPREIAMSLRDRIRAKITLTDEQARQLDVIIERSSAEMHSIHEANGQRIKTCVGQRNAQISAILTPEQQQQFEQMEKERRKSWGSKDSDRDKRGGRDSSRSPSRNKSTDDSRSKTNR